MRWGAGGVVRAVPNHPLAGVMTRGQRASRSRHGNQASTGSCVPQRQDSFHGLIQHSFSLRIPRSLHPQYSRGDISETRQLLKALMEASGTGTGNGFRLMPIDEMTLHSEPPAPAPQHESLLVDSKFTNISVGHLPFTNNDGLQYTYPLPSPFDWAKSRRRLPPQGASGSDPSFDDSVNAREGWVPTERRKDGVLLSNDYLVVADLPSASEPPNQWEPEAVSWLLCQLLAHRRSRLFGWSLERRIFNVLLPHALLRLSGSGSGRPSGDWIVQPALSLFLGEEDRGFRPIFSISLFMVPVESSLILMERRMTTDEIYQTVQASWSVATTRLPSTRPSFDVYGPLHDYVSAFDSYLPVHLSAAVQQTGGSWGSLTLRQIAETVLFAVTLRMVEGPEDTAEEQAREKVATSVLVALSSSRASSVVVVDEEFDRREQMEASETGSFPGSLGRLMEKISQPVVVAPNRNRYRLDRPFYDEDDYAIGVLPANRCIVVTSDICSQQGYRESGLLQAGWIAYMVIGAATATGMMRSIYHEIEQVDRSRPNAIAAIEREVVVDLHEIYDLDITWEQYRHRYRLLRDALGITRDYEALQSKLQALSRETNTRFEDTSDTRLAWLTAAIVFLTLVTVIVTVVAK